MFCEELINEITKLSNRDWIDYATIIISIISIVISIVATIINIWLVNKNTNRQIENQNKETYRPRLKLKSISIKKSVGSERYLYINSKNFEEKKNKLSIYLNVCLENVGYGIANDITFYSLTGGYKCLGIQSEYKNITQELNSTLEIPKDKFQNINFKVEFNRDMYNEETNIFGEEDFILLICNYKDLNNNNYKLLIGCILKKYNPYELELDEKSDLKSVYTSGEISYYYYQEETESYKGMVSKDIYADNYRKILKDINNK